MGGALCLFFYKDLGTIKFFYFIVINLIIFAVITGLTLIRVLRENLTFSYTICLFTVIDTLESAFVVNFDCLTGIMIILVCFLTLVALVFGMEYLSREAFIYNVLTNLYMFAVSIILFFVMYTFSALIIC